MNYYRKPIHSTISIILVLLMTFLLPIQVFAETTPKPKVENSVKFDSLAESEETANIVTELRERRDEYTKHFRMDDGTIMAVTYDCPVHYKNDKGKWIEYDNSLIGEYPATPDEVKTKSYTNKKSDIDIDLSIDSKSDALVNINTKKGSISWRYEGSKKSDARIKNNKNKHKGNAKFTSIDKLSSKANYKDLYQNVDLECIVNTTGVKDNIILHNAEVKNEFIIEYNIKGLNANKIDNQTIQINNNKGKSVYIISAPCMYDAKGKQSTDLTFNILSNKNDKLIVKLTADKSFINDKERVFPVTIDPEVTVVGNPEIETAEIDHSNTSYIPHQQSMFTVGKTISPVNNTTTYYSGLVQIKNLQENYADKNIVSAKLNIFPLYLIPEMEIEARPVLTSWSNSTASYNSVHFEDDIEHGKVIDYAHTKNASLNCVTFDLTKYTKKWANGSVANNGICLVSSDDFGQFGGYYSRNNDCYPTFVVKYKEYTGLESNLTSHTISCGQNAEAYVCDYTGALTVKQNIYEEAGSRIPLSIYAVHNSTKREERSYIGKGWHMSFDKRLTNTGAYYVYLDSDNVEHYFKKESNLNELFDEDDLGYTLTINTNNNTISIDTGSAIEKFDIPNDNETTYIKTETDSENSNNQIIYTYDSSDRITQIQSAQHIYSLYSFTTTSDGNTVSVCDNIKKDGEIFVRFIYYGGYGLSSGIRFNDGKRSTFGYSNNYMQFIRQYSTSDDQYGNKLNFDYSDGKVSNITEYGDNNTSIHSLSVQCNDDNTTVFKSDNDNNKKETYTFDNYGNTVTVLNANGMITNASDSGSLNINTGSDSYTYNFIKDSNEPQNMNNYHSESDTIDNQHSSGGTVTVDNNTAYLGHQSIKIDHDSSSAIYTYAYQNVDGTSLRNKSATFSAYVKPDDIKVGNLSGKSGAMLMIECYTASGTLLTQEESTAITSTPNETGWERLSVTTEVPAQTMWIKIRLILRNAQGSAYFDCLQLEEGSVMNDYNALINSNFYTEDYWKTQDENEITLNNDDNAEIVGVGGEPAPEAEEDEEPTDETSVTCATETETVVETVDNDIAEATDSYGNVTKTEQGFVSRTYLRTYEATEEQESTQEPIEELGATSDEITDETETNPNKFIYQEVAINKKDVVFNISGTAKADSVPLNNEYRTFGIALKIKYQNDTDYTESHYQEFNAYTDAWQNVSLSVTPYEDNIVESVEFAFVYGYNKNKMTIKNAMLNYTCYDADKTPASTETTSSTEPSSSENTTEPTSTTEFEDEDEEDDERVLIDEEVVTEEVDESKTHIKSSCIYNTEPTFGGNYVISEVNEAGNTVSYDYDNNGNISEITDGRGNTTSYSYDVHSNLLSVANDDSSNTYTYNSRNDIASVSHNNFSYNYSYDSYGNLQSVNVGNTPLASYSYNSGDTLSQMQYGNGDKLKYTYDSYDRITTIKDEDDNILAEYDYNKKGLVTRFTDDKSGEVTDYVYDCHGNTMSVLVSSGSGTLLKQLTGDIEKTKINGIEYTIENGTDENDKEYVDYGGVRVTTETDDFGRTSSVTSSGYILSYTYKGVTGSNATTNLVDTITYELDNNTIAGYTYTYDANGNITQVKEGNTIIASYLYDNLNQLWSVNYRSRNLYFTYYYDNSGNITSQSIQNLHPTYGYPIGTTETITYTYDDSEWKDKLTAYNGDTINYDNIGNPLSYRDGMSMTWQNGRELASIKDNNNITYSFTYNLNGLRTKKSENINNTNTYYYYDSNNNLVGMKKGSNTVLYYYDSDGGLVSMSVEGSGNNPDTTYLFVKNLQGDITKILDNSGDVVATYAYDAWGKILAETEDSSIAGLNPFRYRGYVYDPETELYYLQSRYYDPLTGRFINADSPEYTDTGSGSPLSTNMFAYCENNPVSGYDPSGNWTLSLHSDLCTQKGSTFTDLVIRCNKLCDETFSSQRDYSAPFHSRDTLNTAKALFNAAIDLRNKKPVEICFCDSEHLKQGFSKDKKKYFIPQKYLSYKKNDHSLLEKYNERESILAFLNNKASNNFYNKYGDRYRINAKNKQSKALLGFALHAAQDHFAHNVYLYYATNKTNLKKYMKSGKTNDKYYLKTYKFNAKFNKTQLPKNQFEDSPDIFTWRYQQAGAVSKVLYKLYKEKKKIKSITTKKYGKTDHIYHYIRYVLKNYYFNTVKFQLIIKDNKNNTYKTNEYK